MEPLLLLLQATQLDGKALPRESFTAMAVGDRVQQITGFRPIDIEVVTNRDVIVEFEPPPDLVKLHKGCTESGSGMGRWQIWGVY